MNPTGHDCGRPGERSTTSGTDLCNRHPASVTHHLDNDKANCEPWNLAALCQRCHLRIQGRVIFAQAWMLEHSGWMKPHVEGFKVWVGQQDDAARVRMGLELIGNRSISAVIVRAR